MVALAVVRGAAGLLDRFAAHCRDDLDDVELLAAHPTSLDLRWRGGEGTVELRAGLLGAERLEGVHLMLTTIDERAVNRFLDDEQLRGRIALCDVARLEKINAVRSSLCVYFEWFLREAIRSPNTPGRGLHRGPRAARHPVARHGLSIDQRRCYCPPRWPPPPLRRR